MRTVRALLGSLPIFVCVVDRFDRLIWVNQYLLDRNGVKPSALLGRIIGEVWPEAAELTDLREAARITGKPQSTAKASWTLSGDRVWLYVSALPMARGRVCVVCIDRAAEVRAHALRSLMETVTTPGPAPAAPDPIGPLLLAGRSERDLCAALDVGVDELRAMLVRLAR